MSQPFISIGVVAFKGGVGKTTIAAGLADALCQIGPVLLVDCDHQQSATSQRLTAVQAANAANDRLTTFGTIYCFNQTRLPAGTVDRQGTATVLRSMAGGAYSQLPDLDRAGKPLSSQPPTPTPRVLIVDAPPSTVSIAAGIADYLNDCPRGTLLVATSANDLDIGNALQTLEVFRKSHPGLKTWLVLNQVVTNRVDHREHREKLTSESSPWPTLKTVVPARAEIARMFRHDRMGRPGDATMVFNAMAAEILQFWTKPKEGVA